jgi:hypothetical protein
VATPTAHSRKSFLLLFFKKEGLAYSGGIFWPALMPPHESCTGGGGGSSRTGCSKHLLPQFKAR